METQCRRRMSRVLAVAAMALASAVGAQGLPPASDSQLAEVVVTAQRREQNLQDVGISVSAFSGETLKNLGVDSSIDVARLTPGVHVSGSLAGESSNFTIRGVTQSDYNDAIEAPVAVYVDDTYIPSLQGQSFGLFDIQRVEILKGPQGTLFGRNATGGLVQYVVNKPTDKLEASLDVSYGRFNLKTIEAVLSGPLNDTLSFRFSGYYSAFGNVMTNIWPDGLEPGFPTNFGSLPSPCCQNTWADDTLAGRLQLQYRANALTMRLSVSASRQNLSTAPYSVEPVVPVVDSQGRLINAIYAGPNETRVAVGPDGGNFLGIPGSPPFRLPGRDWLGFLPPPQEDLQVSEDYSRSNYNHARSADAALHIDYDFSNGMTLTSITSYTKFEKRFYTEGEGGPVNFIDVGQLGDTKSYSEELRLSGKTASLRWVSGLYLLHIDALARDGLLAPAGSLFASLFGLTAVGVDLPSISNLKTNSYSLFGQLEYDLSPHWTAVLGARFINEHQDFDFTSLATANINDWTLDTSQTLFVSQPPFTDKRTENLWAGKAQIEYRPDRDLLLYMGINRGVKAGSYNSKLYDGTAPLPPSQIPYKPEALLAYEGGFKKTFAGGAGTLNGALFYYDYHDYQAFTFQNVAGYVQNRDARTYGGELEATARPWTGMQISLAASAFNALVKGVEIAPGISGDVQPTYAPEQQFFGVISQDLRADALGGVLTFAVDGSYTSYFYHNIRNFDSTRLPGYALFDVRATWVSSHVPLELTAYCDNIGDKRYVNIGFEGSSIFGGNAVSFGRPRWWGVRAVYKFGSK